MITKVKFYFSTTVKSAIKCATGEKKGVKPKSPSRKDDNILMNNRLVKILIFLYHHINIRNVTMGQDNFSSQVSYLSTSEI